MISYGSEVSIQASPEDVFPYLVSAEKQAQWSDVQMVSMTEGPLRVGSRLAVAFGGGPLRMRITMEFTELEPNRVVAWRTFDGAIRWDGAYRLEAAGASATRVTQSGRLEFRGLWRLIEPIVGAEIRQGEIKELEKLKRVIEHGAGAELG